MKYVELNKKEVGERIMSGELRGLFYKNSKDELISVNKIIWSLEMFSSYRFFTNEKRD